MESLVSCEWLKEQIDNNVSGIRVLDGKIKQNDRGCKICLNS